jgi:hypothetical protein
VMIYFVLRFGTSEIYARGATINNFLELVIAIPII